MALDPKIPYQDITYQIMGAAMRVHNKIGPGYKERFYHRALTAELRAADLSVEEEYPFELCVENTFIGRILSRSTGRRERGR
jgi:GxxExxY protein